MNGSFIKRIHPVPLCKKEMLRYAGVRGKDLRSEALLEECLNELGEDISGSVCYTKLNLSVRNDICDFGCFSLCSSDLAKSLKDCSEVILFAATSGLKIDRLTQKYSRISPSKGVMFQAIGAGLTEEICDLFCRQLEECEGIYLKPRFSPGYGNLSLAVQKDIFRVLCCEKIGMTLTDSLLMSPAKSVTAFAGISRDLWENKQNKCSLCPKTDCIYRGI